MNDIHVEVQSACSSGAIPSTGDFQHWASAAVGDHRNRAEISIRLVDSEESAAFNAKYRDKQGPTNVLSFPADLPPELELPLLGDLIICAPVVEREASDQGKTLSSHWAHMVVHGTLHLLGYDHIDDEDAEQMESLETRILASLGFPNPYETT